MASPTITATKPKQIVAADDIGCLKISIWNRKRYAASGTTALTCSKILVNVYGAKRDKAFDGETLIFPGLRVFPLAGFGVSRS